MSLEQEKIQYQLAEGTIKTTEQAQAVLATFLDTTVPAGYFLSFGLDEHPVLMRLVQETGYLEGQAWYIDRGEDGPERWVTRCYAATALGPGAYIHVKDTFIDFGDDPSKTETTLVRHTSEDDRVLLSQMNVGL